MLDASRLERFRTVLRRDAVRHAHRAFGVEPRGVVVRGAEGTCVKLVLKARAELPKPAVRAEDGEERRRSSSLGECSAWWMLMGRRSFRSKGPDGRPAAAYAMDAMCSTRLGCSVPIVHACDPTGIPDSSPRILKTYVRYDATVGYSDAYERA